MTPRYVALDTETTGLDLENDEVIEVAAIAFDLNGILDEFQTLVCPRRQPSFHIERLTGISTQKLQGAPSIYEVAPQIAAFIGDSPVVGQSVDFDLTFLSRFAVHPPGPVYDTFSLAQLLLPGLSDYSLRGLAEYLGVDFPTRHRAYVDADAARGVFLGLRKLLTELPGWLLHDIERLARLGDWALADVVREVIEASPRGLDFAAGLTSDLLAPPHELGRALNGGNPDGQVHQEEALAVLAGAERLSQFFPVFEKRDEQENMASAVTGALSNSRHLVVEAGTGTGKSLAYLVPAALHALRRQERVIVSTDTIGLQEQLIEKDLPVVQALIAATDEEPLRVAALKGRRNYLCLQRWTAARHVPPLSQEDARLQARILVWLRTTQTGDRAELGLYGPAYDAAWNRLSAENTACLQNGCPFVRQGTCFLYRARKRAEAAHILVVNHALLLSDVATGGHVLPSYSHLIIDEAHNLEDEATSRLAFRASEGDVAELLERVGRRAGSGVVGTLNDAMRGTANLLMPSTYLAGIGTSLNQAASRVRQRLADPFRLLNSVLRDYSQSDRENDDRLLVTRAIRVQPIWSDLEIAAENLDTAFGGLISLLEDLRGLLETSEQGLLSQETLAAEVNDLWQMAFNLQQGLSRALLDDDPSLICWLERVRSTGEVAVCTAPLDVADVLRASLFEQKDSVILTSATLSAGGGFEFLRQRVGLEDADELLLGSPFDFPSSTLITIPTDLPEPNQPDFIVSMNQLLIDACRASQGRALVLFTSYGTLRAVYESIKPVLEAEGILVLGHGIDGSPRQMLSALRENSRTVLLGTASFWEGVDVVGEALSLLVIVRLPFAVPTDPIYQARSALYDEPFDQYALPQAVLRFRQGFGRLIRSRTDRGVLLVLDRRIKGRRYGETFLNALPACTVKDLSSREVPHAVETWLA